jgi:2-oxoglutarate ferredoxin oxidoreductase subunit gamma
MNGTQTESYGPEARGGACRSEVVISDEEIDYPNVETPDVLIAMSQLAYKMYSSDIKENGTIILDPDMIPYRTTLKKVKNYEIPATRIAEKAGSRVVANSVMLGAFAAIFKIIERTAMEKAIAANFPPEARKMNLLAFRRGYNLAKKLMRRT